MAAHHPNSFGAWLRSARGVPFEEWAGGRSADPFGVRIKTRFTDLLSKTTDRRVRLGTVRNMAFTRTERNMAPGHSHPKAAALRADASVFMSKVATDLRLRRYDVSVAARERGGLATGPRQLRSVKDLLSDSQQAKLTPQDLVTMVDTDYYMSEPEFSVYAGHDIAMYSLRPDGMSGRTDESAWSFTSAEEVTEEVSGGATYSHQVWDWGKDLLVLGKGFKTYVYDVVDFPVGRARGVTVLVLARTVSLPLWLFAWLYPDVGRFRMNRLKVEQKGGFLVGSFGSPGGRMMSVKPAGNAGVSAVQVSPDTFQALGVAARIPNTDKKVPGFELLPSAVERICKAMGEPVSTAGCYVLADYFTRAFKPHQLVNYQSAGKYVLEEGKAGAALAAVPLAGYGVSPTSSHNNEARAIKARVVDVANTKPFPADLKAYAAEFAEKVVTRTHKGVPWSSEELRDAQPRPTQRARRLKEEAFTADERPSLTTTSFQKKETYPKVGDPRLINQVPTDHTNRLCSFAGALKTVFGSRGNKHWYMVGKTPLGIAYSLRNLRQAAGARLIGGDYSRMDGRTSVAYRQEVLEPIMLRFFHPKFHPELQALLKKEETARTFTRGFGIKADMGGANLSGSGVTTVLNTLDAAFNEYGARRRSGQDPATAFKRLGCYFGDDSAVSPEAFAPTVQVAEECGMKLEEEITPEGAGEGYVVFLSRVYPDIRTSLASHPCIVRALKKVCTVQVPPGEQAIHLLTKLRLKIEGVLITDSHVPVLSEYVHALSRVYKLEEKSHKGEFWENLKAESATYRAKSATGAYPYERGDSELLLASVCQGLGITPEEGQLLMRRLDEAKTEADLMACSLQSDQPVLPEWAEWVPTVAI